MFLYLFFLYFFRTNNKLGSRSFYHAFVDLGLLVKFEILVKSFFFIHFYTDVYCVDACSFELLLSLLNCNLVVIKKIKIFVSIHWHTQYFVYQSIGCWKWRRKSPSVTTWKRYSRKYVSWKQGYSNFVLFCRKASLSELSMIFFGWSSTWKKEVLEIKSWSFYSFSWWTLQYRCIFFVICGHTREENKLQIFFKYHSALWYKILLHLFISKWVRSHSHLFHYFKSALPIPFIFQKKQDTQ